METTMTKKVKQWTIGLGIAAMGVSTMAMPSQATVAEASSSKTYQTSANLNLRTGASIHSKRILTMPKGSKVAFISTKHGWHKIKFGSRVGYASSKYLKKPGTVKKASYSKASTKRYASSGYVRKVMDVEVTAYTFNYGSNITASGKRLAVGDVAAPREIPFGSIVDIPSIEKRLGKSTLKVYDRGGAIKRLGANKIRIDVAFPSYRDAINFGRKTYKNVPVYVKR